MKNEQILSDEALQQAQTFNQQRYLRIDQLISVDLALTCAIYAKAMEKHQYTGGDQQAPNSNSVYGDFLMESLLGMSLPKVEEITGLALSPTYSYYRVYKAGEELKEHCDRPACEVSLSLCLGYDYLGKNFRWRFAIGDKKIALEPGDAVIYRGMELPHSRPKLQTPEGSWHAQTFLHYV